MTRQPIYKIGDTVYVAHDGEYPNSLEIEKPAKVMGMALESNGTMTYYFEGNELIELPEECLYGSKEELFAHITAWLLATPRAKK